MALWGFSWSLCGSLELSGALWGSLGLSGALVRARTCETGPYNQHHFVFTTPVVTGFLCELEPVTYLGPHNQHHFVFTTPAVTGFLCKLEPVTYLGPYNQHHFSISAVTGFLCELEPVTYLVHITSPISVFLGNECVTRALFVAGLFCFFHV